MESSNKSSSQSWFILATPDLIVGPALGKDINKVLVKLDELQATGVTGVLNLCGFSHTKEQIWVPDYGMDYKFIDVFFLSLLNIQNLKEAVSFIDSQIAKGGKAYVHCSFGRDRSPMMIAMHLIYKGMSPNEAKEFLKSKNIEISTGQDCLERLQEWHDSGRQEEMLDFHA